MTSTVTTRFASLRCARGATSAGTAHEGDRSRRPLLLAHRGAAGPGRPENTVAAVSAALAAGADGVEIDVRASADGHLLCIHDPDLSRLTGVTLAVSSHTAATLRRVALPGGHTMPLLEELLTEAGGHGRRRVVVEAKACPDHASARVVSNALVEVLPSFTRALDLTVSSFDADLLATIRTAVRGIGVRTALLGSPFDTAAVLLRQTVTAGHDEMHPNVRSLLRAPQVADAARTLGVAVTCWTVNRPREALRLAELGVTALITDDAAALRCALPALPHDRKSAAAAGR